MSHWSDKLYGVAISFASSGENEIVASPGAGKRIAVDLLNFMTTTANNVTIKDGSTALSGAYPLAAQSGIVLENVFKNHDGVITCSPNTALVLSTSAATQVSGFVRYRVLDNS